MIYFFTGKPGNGKSLHMAQIIYHSLLKGKNVISNIDINMHVFDKVKHREKMGQFIYIDNVYWLNSAYKGINKNYKGSQDSKAHYSYIDGLYGFALNFHKKNNRGQMLENQTILVLDECQELFNTRSWSRKDRLEWCRFFRIHRHYGFNCYLISQDDKVIDKQIRAILQKELEHRCMNNYKLLGKFMGLLCGGKLFIVIERDYTLSGKKASKMSSYYFRGKRKFYEFYDSYALLHDTEQLSVSET